jgi:hypothetical protein
MLSFAENELTPRYRRFFLIYNVCLLGALCLALLASSLHLLYIKLTFGLWWIGPLGFLPGGIHIVLLVMSILAWSLSCIKTWLLTKDTLRIRIFSFLYLFISPMIIGSVFFILVKLIILPYASKF